MKTVSTYTFLYRFEAVTLFFGGVLIFVANEKYIFKSWSSRTKRNSASPEFVVCINTIMFHETIFQIPAMQNIAAIPKKTGNRSN